MCIRDSSTLPTPSPFAPPPNQQAPSRRCGGPRADVGWKGCVRSCGESMDGVGWRRTGGGKLKERRQEVMREGAEKGIKERRGMEEGERENGHEDLIL
eukprot:4855116-Pyramimonas_sp.AAC.4